MAQTRVSTIELQPSPITYSLSLNGDIIAIEQSSLSAEVSARVQEVLFEAGDFVTQGEALIKLDSSVQEFELDRSRAVLERLDAEVDLAQLEKKRLLKLLTRSAASQEEFDQAEARLRQAKADVLAQRAQVGIEQDQLTKYTVSAPFDGIVSERLVSPGTLIQINQELAQLTQTQPLRLAVAVPQDHFTALNRALGEADSKPVLEIVQRSKYFTGRPTNRIPVERIVGAIDENRQFSVWGEIDNENQQWQAGMAVTAILTWQSQSAPGVFTVPADALVQRANGNTVIWKVASSEDSSSAEPVSVVVESRTANGIAGRSLETNALAAGELIIVLGNESLKAGQAIEASPMHPPSNGA